ncbi:glycosyltransferase family 2 protein [Nocardioides insulae]|uniref:glycosyltransferase family 2 protein n=1 Tax=Nocardioides insulae TaxID=394734 RepID=UPI00040EDD99|nr:glycosyltransferase family 2 protein [Nocardioides insulae]
MHPSVALLLVSHDGARWLPTVLDGVAAQRVQPARVVAIDTGSKDDGPDLLRAAFGEVHRLKAATTFPEAIAFGLDEVRRRAAEEADQADLVDQAGPEWIWILHDDSTPGPGALEALLAAAAEHPEVDVLGPKLREWPSLRRLLEVGVTISGTGRRETGLERAEYDQGQHDEIRTVLAVNTAGMLVRRRVLEELGGFDEHLPMFGNDIDFGWRAATAGARTIVVPAAVVFHAEAAHRGVRRTPLTGRHTHYQERRAALYTLLVNCRRRSLPFQLVRLLLGTLIRMVGFLLVRSVGEALDELAALASVYSRPGAVHAGRRERHGRQNTPPAQVRRLLPPWWLPYRHGLDFVGDVVSAATDQAADVAERRRAAKAEQDPASFAARRPVVDPDDPDAIPEDTGLAARFFTNPVAVLLAITVVLGLIAARDAFGPVSGGGLSPAPEGVGEWWSLHFDSWHVLGQGTQVPAPAYLLPLALLATVLAGKPAVAVSVVLVLAFPLALWGAWRLLRVLGRLVSVHGAPRSLILWGATAYALIAATSGAWGDGRLSTVVTATALPWLAHAALGFADPEADRRWRAGWRTGLLLAMIVAFTPMAWLVAVVLGVVVLAVAFALLRSAMRDRSTWGPPAVALLVPVVVLLPWWLPALVHGAGGALLLDGGRLPMPATDGTGLLLGRLGEAGDWAGAPWWLGLVLPVLALLALIPSRTRIPVLICWTAGVVTAVVAAALSFVSLDLGAATSPAGLGFALVVLQGAAVLAAVLGAQGVLAEGLGGWRRPVAGVVALIAVLAPVGGLAWWVSTGADEMADGIDDGLPAYMLTDARDAPENGILVLRGTTESGLDYTVVRGDGVTLGDDEIEALTPEDDGFTALVSDFVSSATSEETVTDLAAAGIRYVVLPAPADAGVASAVDATGGLSQASSADRGSRAWQLDETASADQLRGDQEWWRIVLLVIQALALIGVAVLCLPTIERRRSR